MGSVRLSLSVAAMAAALATGVGAGVAHGVPEQGGTTPGVPEQGGTTPAPSPGNEVPLVEPGPGSVPGPPQEAPYQPYVPEVIDYGDRYSPVPNRPLTAPKPVAPVRPIAPPPNKIRIGNFITDIPQGMSVRDVNSINAWSAYGESKIAQGLISVGVPKDEASRQAASTIIGVMAGGTVAVGATVAAAAVGGLAGAAVGAGIGAAVGLAIEPLAPWPFVGPGALIGAGVGAVTGAALLGVPVAVVGLAGTVAAGVVAYTLGAGDPGANPRAPWQQNPGPKHALPNPEGNQFVLTLGPDEAKRAGLPAVSYVVNKRGDVSGNIAGQKFGWSVEQATAPYRVLGPQVEQSARALTKQGAAALKSVVPGVNIAWPQEARPN
ncbi:MULTISPECIES: hypothetical protein [unclassified Gordonia (in: high G+C Gram-positive bacteria)]|uniref:hypothetical protein n=1 Tax=unclassified Gordonia (in: high G+C Gram-positive bacteria) TaxID=2657482 RepID=UPI001F0EDEFC|nr:hypothetical protein [Gordonia sp. ABSL49_1]MCH5641367.1 hypothetical protein [Gordonia sp. ABSL49_1]